MGDYPELGITEELLRQLRRFEKDHNVSIFSDFDVVLFKTKILMVIPADRGGMLLAYNVDKDLSMPQVIGMPIDEGEIHLSFNFEPFVSVNQVMQKLEECYNRVTKEEEHA